MDPRLTWDEFWISISDRKARWRADEDSWHGDTESFTLLNGDKLCSTLFDKGALGFQYNTGAKADGAISIAEFFPELDVAALDKELELRMTYLTDLRESFRERAKVDMKSAGP